MSRQQLTVIFWCRSGSLYGSRNFNRISTTAEYRGNCEHWRRFESFKFSNFLFSFRVFHWRQFVFDYFRDILCLPYGLSEPGAVLRMSEQGAMEGPCLQLGAQPSTPLSCSAVLVMQQHIVVLLKYRRGDLHLGGPQGHTFEWGRAPQIPLQNRPCLSLVTTVVDVMYSSTYSAFVYQQDYALTVRPIFTKFGEKVAHGLQKTQQVLMAIRTTLRQGKGLGRVNS